MPFLSPYGDCPVWERPLHDLLFEHIDEAIKKDPHKKAFINASNPDDFITHSQLRQSAASVAQFLHNHGFMRQTACTVMYNCHQYFSFFLGVSLQGGKQSGISPLFTESEMERQIVNSDAAIVLTDKANLDRVLRVSQRNQQIKLVIVADALDASTLPSGVIPWSSVISTIPDLTREKVLVTPDDVAFLPYSSGTTGASKGVMLTHRNLGTMTLAYIKSENRNAMLSGLNFDWTKEAMIIPFPQGFVSGFLFTCFAIVRNATVVFLPMFEFKLFLETVQTYQAKHIIAVPSTLVLLAKNRLCDNYDLSSLKKITTGGAPAGKDIFEELLKKYTHLQTVGQAYGMTELAVFSHVADARSDKKFGSVGKPICGLQCKIVDIETGDELPAGERGEICIKGPTVMLGYYNNPEATKEAVKDGWMHSGDIGYMDADGDLFISDRLKELIKVNSDTAYQVAPAELEGLLLTHPMILDAAVVGVPDETAGELPKAFIVRKDEKLTAGEVFNFVKDNAAPYKQLHGGIEFIEAIPKSPLGKILRRKLKEINNAMK